jgi:hypothetical protein
VTPRTQLLADVAGDVQLLAAIVRRTIDGPASSDALLLAAEALDEIAREMLFEPDAAAFELASIVNRWAARLREAAPAHVRFLN